MNLSEEIRVTPAEPSELAAVVAMLSGRSDAWADDNRESVELDSGDGLFVARQGDRMLAAVWARKIIDGVFVLWLPDSSSDDVISRLLNTLDQFLWKNEFRFARANVSPSNTRLAAHLSKNEFIAAATVDSLYWSVPDHPARITVLSDALQIIPATSEYHERFIEVTKSTYLSSLDCPSIMQALSPDDVLACYLSTPDSIQAHSFIAQRNGQDVGCLVLHLAMEELRVDLSYVGLSPSFRQLGMGRALIEYAQAFAIEAGCQIVTTAVDSKNTPATGLYNATGFAWYASSRLFAKLPRKKTT